MRRLIDWETSRVMAIGPESSCHQEKGSGRRQQSSRHSINWAGRLFLHTQRNHVVINVVFINSNRISFNEHCRYIIEKKSRNRRDVVSGVVKVPGIILCYCYSSSLSSKPRRSKWSIHHKTKLKSLIFFFLIHTTSPNRITKLDWLSHRFYVPTSTLRPREQWPLVSWIWLDCLHFQRLIVLIIFTQCHVTEHNAILCS